MKQLKNIEENKKILDLLGANETKPRYQKAIINSADKSLIKAICESAHNLLNGNIPLGQDFKEKLRKFKNQLSNLVKKSKLKEKKKFLIQRGGFLKFLIPIVISSLASALTQ